MLKYLYFQTILRQIYLILIERDFLDEARIKTWQRKKSANHIYIPASRHLTTVRKFYLPVTWNTPGYSCL